MYFASNHENNALLFYCFEDIFLKYTVNEIAVTEHSINAGNEMNKWNESAVI